MPGWSIFSGIRLGGIGSRVSDRIVFERTKFESGMSGVDVRLQSGKRLEVATLRLARACGIRTPDVRLELADTPFPVALIRRFDRRGIARIPYISARTALGKTGTELGSYTEIVDFMRTAAAEP
jgi:serine/threonine-protein kinase HipA